MPSLVHVFRLVENDGFNIVEKLAKPLTCTTVAYNFITLTTICEQTD